VIPVRFYSSEAGNEPVREWLRGLEAGDRRAIWIDLRRVQFRWPVGMPLVRNLKDGLWEVRSTLPSHRIARLILCGHEGVLIVLHGFIKKTQNEGDDGMKKRKPRNKHIGSSVEDFLREEGILEEATAIAIKEVVAWQIEQAMLKDNVTKMEMAKRMRTSRAALNRLLDPANDSVTLQTLTRAARAIGRELRIELV
jgi:phage-related protein